MVSASYADDERRLCWVGNFFVHPEWRRRGVGRRLLEHLLSAVRRERTAPVVGLCAITTNPIVTFYEQYGFTHVAGWAKNSYEGMQSTMLIH